MCESKIDARSFIEALVNKCVQDSDRLAFRVTEKLDTVKCMMVEDWSRYYHSIAKVNYRKKLSIKCTVGRLLSFCIIKKTLRLQNKMYLSLL